jgi:phosphatidylglycerol:prolipoprotein diacylglycerol transferase|tara:strand:+ start:19350 stop:20123 length:774 start_codon:yes stop_codon:yes gene_type:complete
MFINNINPILFQLWHFQVRYYGLIYVLGFIIAYYMISYLVKKRHINLTKDDLSDFIFYLIIGVVLGARLGHVLANFKFYSNNLLQIFALWNGGLAFHGGLIGVLIVSYYFTKKKNINFYDLADIVVIPATLALGFGRIGNFLNGELYGKITDVPWAVKFQNAEGFRHPTQIYESLKNFFIFFTLWSLKNKELPKGFLFWLFITLYGFFRFIIESYREPISALGFIIFNQTITQLFNILMLVVGLVMLYKLRKNVNKI